MKKYLFLLIISFSFSQNQEVFTIILKNGDFVNVTEFRDTGQSIIIPADIIEGDSKPKSYSYNDIDKILVTIKGI